MKQVVINEDDCLGCNACVELCPDIFAFNDNSEKAHVIKPEGGDPACIDEAMASCPGNCISQE